MFHVPVSLVCYRLISGLGVDGQLFLPWSAASDHEDADSKKWLVKFMARTLCFLIGYTFVYKLSYKRR